MPQFEVELEDGRKYAVEADKEPSREEVAAALKQTEQAPQQPTSSAVGAAARSAATGAVPALAGAGGFAAGFEAGLPLAPFAGPAAPAVPFVTGAIGAGLAGFGAGKAQQAIIHKAAPQFEQQQAADVAQHPVASAVGGIAAALPTFELSPGQSIRGLAAVPALLKGTATAAQRKAVAATAVQVGTQTGLTTAQSAISEGKLPSKGELAEAGISALIYGNPRIKALLPRSVGAAQRATGVTPDASQIQEAAALHGNVRPQQAPAQGVPLAQGGAGIQPRPEALATKAPLLVNAAVRFGDRIETGKNHPEILQRVGGEELRDRFASKESRNTPDFGFVDEAGNFLTREESAERAKITKQDLNDVKKPHSTDVESATQPGKSISETGLSKEHQEALFKEAEAIGRTVRVISEDDLDPNNAPFAKTVRGKVATIDRASGTILVNPKEFSEWLSKDVPKGKETEAMRSLLSEENIHLATPDEAALGYVRSLTSLEKKIGQRVYGGPYGEAMNELQLGHEMLRTRMQQLARMPVREAIERSRRERWTVKSLLAVGRAVQGIREALGTKASKEGLAILDRIQGNLDAATAVAQGQAPAMTRKRRETSTQGIMYLPPVQGEVERPTATEAGAQPVTTKKQLAPHAVGFDEAGPSALRAITEAESASPKELTSILTQGARTGGSKAPPSRTHRVTALFDKLTGRVDVVSTYLEDRAVKMGDPTLLSEDRARPHRPLERLLDRYQPLYSIYLTDPVQNFHERFESMEQFQKEFALPAREAAEGALGARVGSDLTHTPYVRPTYAEAPHPDDVGALYDAVKKFPASSPEKMREAIARKPMAFSKKALTALDAMVTREMVSNKNLSAEEAIANSLDKLYENSTQASSRDDFTQRTMGDFAPRTPETTGQAQAAPAPKPSISGARELTLPRFARRGVPAEQLPPSMAGMPAERQVLTPAEQAALERRGQLGVGQVGLKGWGTRPLQAAYGDLATNIRGRQLQQQGVDPTKRYTLGVEKPVSQVFEQAPETKPEFEQEEFIGRLAKSEGTPEPEPPAMTRKVLAESRDRSMAEVERVKNAFTTFMQRREIKDEIAALRDVADNTANSVAEQTGIRVAVAAGAEGKRMRGADKQLNSIHTLIASHAISADYNLAKAGPEARKRFYELMKADNRLAAAMGRRTSDPAQAALLFEEIKQDAFQQLVNEKLLRSDSAKYSFNESAKGRIDALLKKVDKAETKQEAILRTGTYRQKVEAREMLKYLPKLRESAQWAKDNWTNPELRRGAFQFKKELDQSFQRQVDSGKTLRYDRDYTPGRYEDEFYGENYILFPARRTLGLKWEQPKHFANYFEAAENGYKAVTLNAANLAEHSIRQAQRSNNYGALWLNYLTSTADPTTGLPIGKVVKVGADGKPISAGYDYTNVPVRPNTFMAIHNGYVDLIKALTSESKVQEFAPARIALEMEQRLKHTILVGDLFHMFREAYYAQAIAGLGRRAGWRQGLAAIQFRPEDMPQAVKQGVISQKAMDWALTKVPVKMGSKTVDMTRHEIAQRMMQRGLNVGQIQDALYLDLTKGIPFIGPQIQRYNRFLFNKFTRGLMMESAVHEFERLNAKHPTIDADVLMRDIAKDTNRFFGSIGRQGWFKSATWRDLSRLAFLAPQWVEGLVDKEAALPKRLVGGALSSVGLPGGRKGLPKLGTLGGGIGSGLVAMLALTQAINLITRGKPTWMNEEPEHKWDAWLYGGKNGFFLSPLAVFNELTHDLVRLFQSKPKAWDAVNQIGQNKLSPFGHMALILATDKSARGEYQTTTGGVLKEAGKALLPVPISFGTVGREAASRALPGVVSPPPAGAAQRQMLQWVGLKAEPAQGAAQRITRMAQQFTQASGKGGTGFVFQPTDDPSYAKLRSALRSGDAKTAGAVLSQLEKGRPMQQIGKAMREWAHRPFTGSKRMERAFINSLSPKDQELYSQAMQEKQREYETFLEFLSHR